MIKHIVTWDFAKDYTQQQNDENAKQVKLQLENLINIIDGIIHMEVIIQPLSSSNTDIMLYSIFENEKALSDYQVHPEHKKVGELINKVMQNRKCFDYEFEKAKS